jgi:hypothetical protein
MINELFKKKVQLFENVELLVNLFFRPFPNQWHKLSLYQHQLKQHSKNQELEVGATKLTPKKVIGCLNPGNGRIISSLTQQPSLFQLAKFI